MKLKCLLCGCDFVKLMSKQKYCSERCRDLSHSKFKGNNPLNKYKCFSCKKIAVAIIDKKYLCEKCYIKYKQDKQEKENGKD